MRLRYALNGYKLMFLVVSFRWCTLAKHGISREAKIALILACFVFARDFASPPLHQTPSHFSIERFCAHFRWDGLWIF